MNEVIGERKKCSFCGKMLNANFEVTMYHKGFFYHDECFAQFDDSILPNAIRMHKGKKELVDYIKRLFKLTEISPKINAQIKKFIDSNYTYEGLVKSLEYFYEIKGNSIEKSNDGIGIIPHIYQEAKKWFLDNYNKKQTIEKNSHVMIETTPIVVTVSIPEDDTVKRKLINIEEL